MVFAGHREVMWPWEELGQGTFGYGTAQVNGDKTRKGVPSKITRLFSSDKKDDESDLFQHKLSETGNKCVLIYFLLVFSRKIRWFLGLSEEVNTRTRLGPKTVLTNCASLLNHIKLICRKIFSCDKRRKLCAELLGMSVSGGWCRLL